MLRKWPPVMTETEAKLNEQGGVHHYRAARGYDVTKG